MNQKLTMQDLDTLAGRLGVKPTELLDMLYTAAYAQGVRVWEITFLWAAGWVLQWEIEAEAQRRIEEAEQPSFVFATDTREASLSA